MGERARLAAGKDEHFQTGVGGGKINHAFHFGYHPAGDVHGLGAFQAVGNFVEGGRGDDLDQCCTGWVILPDAVLDAGNKDALRGEDGGEVEEEFLGGQDGAAADRIENDITIDEGDEVSGKGRRAAGAMSQLCTCPF